jgi:hypothetical protein
MIELRFISIESENLQAYSMKEAIDDGTTPTFNDEGSSIG